MAARLIKRCLIIFKSDLKGWFPYYFQLKSSFPSPIQLGQPEEGKLCSLDIYPRVGMKLKPGVTHPPPSLVKGTDLNSGDMVLHVHFPLWASVSSSVKDGGLD